jgi:hypothetical protein
MFCKLATGPLQREDNHRNAQMVCDHSKKFLLQNHWVRKAQIHMKASLHGADSIFFK